jgi:hypothetical protein
MRAGMVGWSRAKRMDVVKEHRLTLFGDPSFISFAGVIAISGSN